MLFALNHLPWARPAIVQVDTFVSPTPGQRTTHLRASDGEMIPVQWTGSEYHPSVRRWRRLTAVVNLPPCGYRAFDLVSDPKTRETPAAPAPIPGRCGVEDGVVGITSLRADDGRELLAAPASFVVIEDNSDTWAHGVDRFSMELGRPAFEGSDVIEEGEYVRVVRQRGRWHDSHIELDVVTWRHTPAVELRLRADWREPRQILKFEVPTLLTDARTIAAVPGGVARRTPDGGEEPCQDWIAVEGAVDDAAYSLGVVNEAIYAYDCLGGRLRLTLLRSTPYAEHDPAKLPDDFARPYLDQGWQERRFWLVAGAGEHATLGLPRLAEELQSPAEYVADSPHPGELPREGSFLEVSPDNVCLLACKPAEDGDGIVLRLQETEGRHGDARITIPGMEIDERVSIGAWQIRTFIAQARRPLREVDLLERDGG